jgi:hypothetical protein
MTDKKFPLRTYMVITNQHTWGKGATINEALNNARISYSTECHIAVIDHEEGSIVLFIEDGMSPAFCVKKDVKPYEESAEYDAKWMPSNADPRLKDKPLGLCLNQLTFLSNMDAYDLIGFYEERMREKYPNLPQHLLVKLDNVHQQVISWCDQADADREEAEAKAKPQIKA